MSVVGPQKQDALLDSIQGIWNGSQKKISDLQHDLSQQKEQIQRSQEQLQNLAQTLGVGPSSEGENILDAISGKWKEMESLISQLRSSLLVEKDQNANLVPASILTP
nr:uncharacterized protein LOC129268639 [Lytechinus pictus]